MGKYQAVLDRIVDGEKATILVESIGKEYVLNVSELPKGAKEGSLLDIELTNNTITTIAINHERTEEVSKKVTDQLNAIRAKSKGSKFKRK